MGRIVDKSGCHRKQLHVASKTFAADFLKALAAALKSSRLDTKSLVVTLKLKCCPVSKRLS
jgi:hypothetical protein